MTTREALLLKYIDKHMKGIEVAPFHRPIAPKSQGFNCLSLDIFDTETLKERARNDPNIACNVKNIENVDIVASATELEFAVRDRGELATYDYVLSSHNFEHLPNPIKFLRACGKVLKGNGILSMAIPDKRKTFDYARALTTTADLIESFNSDRSLHTPYQIFDFLANSVVIEGEQVTYKNDLKAIYQDLVLKISQQNNNYVDIHATVFTKESFWSIMTDCALMQLIPFLIVDIQDNGIEFIVHMKNVGYDSMQHIESDLLSTRMNLAKSCFRNI